MPGIYDLFRLAASGAERIPWGNRITAGAVGGALYGTFLGDKDTPFTDRVSKGAFIGVGLGLGAPSIVRGLGRVATGGISGGKIGIAGKYNAIQREGFSALMKPGTLMLGGAAIGAAVAPTGHRKQGALIGAGLGYGFIPGRALYKGYSTLGNIPGAQTTALMTAAAGTIAASSMFGNASPSAESTGLNNEEGTIDYKPISGNMRDRMLAMNASGDLVLGLHGRQHGG
jgi:hypothetical protein